jgi:hypothetical protein
MFTTKKNKTITWIDKLQLEVLVIWRNFNRVAGVEQRYTTISFAKQASKSGLAVYKIALHSLLFTMKVVSNMIGKLAWKYRIKYV